MRPVATFWTKMSCRIFIGNLPIDIKERELEDLFSKYGRIIKGISYQKQNHIFYNPDDQIE